MATAAIRTKVDTNQISYHQRQPADWDMKVVRLATIQSSLRSPALKWKSVHPKPPVAGRTLYSYPFSVKKKFNVDSPSFTPASLTVNGASKTPGLSPKAANAAPFKPRNFSPGTLVLRRRLNF